MSLLSEVEMRSKILRYQLAMKEYICVMMERKQSVWPLWDK